MFFLEKSLKVSFLHVNISLYIWYIIIYKNDTFQKKAREVSSKYHKIGRSIIKTGKHHTKQAKYRTKMHQSSNKMHQLYPRTWSLKPTYTGTDDHVHGYAWPKRWVAIPKALGSHTQSLGQPCPTQLGKDAQGLGQAWAKAYMTFPVWFNDFSWPLLVLFVRRVDSVKTYL